MIKDIIINQIFKGQSASQYFGEEGTYNSSIAIDPDLPIISTGTRTSGFIVPVGSALLSGANVTSHVVRILNNPKNTLTYVVLSNGRLISYNSSLASETLIGTVAGGVAVWAEYYNNYIYIWTGTNISRYGPLNNFPTLVDTVWTGATLGTQTALTNTTYPTLNSVSIPNHVAHVHGDGSMYFTDFINGQGLIHRINTKKVTDEGDTNGTTVPSLYNALDLPFGFYPTDIESYSKSLLITGIYTIDTTINQGKSAFVLWDPTDTVSFYLGPVFLPDPLCTATLNSNGIIYLWTGNAQNGVRLSRYLGGETVQDIAYQEEGLPPFAGAVDALGNRIVWGGFTTNPETASCVWAYGSKDARLPKGIHNIMRGTGTGTTPIITALKYVQQSSNVTPKLVMAWRDGTTRGIDQYSTTATLDSSIRWMFNIGHKVDVVQVKIPLAGAIAANTTIIPTLYFDDLSSSLALTTINNTNYPSKRKVIYKGTELKNTTALNNFMFELVFTGTNPLPVALPITISVDVKEDEAT
ncbi:MAG: hypothetical protein AAB706_00825 [Patescibacteria group bacterium]